jgi:hypothetical protein
LVVTVAVSPARTGFDDELFAEVSRIVFDETRDARAMLHNVRGALSCDARFRVGRVFRVSGGCPCVDEYVDALVEVWRYLGNQDPDVVRSFGAVARTHCRTRVVPDLHRDRRARRTQARTDRLADSTIGRALATEQQRALLRHLVDEAGSAAPLADDAQLVRRLADLRSHEFGGAAEDHVASVVRDMPIVRAAATAFGRRHRDDNGILVSWWEFYVERGLGLRAQLSTWDDQVIEVASADPDDADDIVVLTLTTAVRGSRSPSKSIGTALKTLAARGVLDGRMVETLVEDAHRLTEIVTAAGKAA